MVLPTYPRGAGQVNTISDPFSLNGVEYRSETVATLQNDRVTAGSEVRLQKAVGGRGSTANYPTVAVSRDGGKTWVTPGTSREGGGRPITTANTGLTAAEIRALQPGGNLNRETFNSANLAVTRGGATSTQAAASTSGREQANTPNTDSTAALERELDENERQERKTYDPLLKYPENLKLEYQDCIKFSMLKYQQSFLGLGADATRTQLGAVARSVTVAEGRPTVGTRTPLTTIVLPIPGGINDSNPVGWQDNSLDEIQRAFANIAQSTIQKGGPGGTAAVGAESSNVQNNTGDYQTFAAAKLTELAVGSNGIMQRQYGAITNPNLELLFNGPQLRTFSFTFKLSPRSESEAKIVKKIIRYFKQGMTPKRSRGYLLLQSPHTFAISYVTENKQHPYLNKFKECALTQCNVNYTPDGNYMSFNGNERSMTSYELTLQFQELVPLFDDDYGNNDTGENNNIGY